MNPDRKRDDTASRSLGVQPVLRRAALPPLPRSRAPVLIAGACAALLGTAAVLTLDYREAAPESQAPLGPRTASACNALEIDALVRSQSLAPSDLVTCLAVAGRIDQARATLIGLHGQARVDALQTMFGVAHPIADAGDDRSAGPIMRLIVEFWPQNYMAMFHAGMAAFALGDDLQAASDLSRFLGMYTPQDIWRARAETALADIRRGAPVEGREAHFPE